MYVGMYVCGHISEYIERLTAYIYVSSGLCMYVCTYVCMYVCMYVSTFMFPTVTVPRAPVNVLPPALTKLAEPPSTRAHPKPNEQRRKPVSIHIQILRAFTINDY